MRVGSCRVFTPWLGIWTLAIWITVLCLQVRADNTQYVSFTTDDGTVYLDNNRQPALYTGAFGDCQGNSLINVTRFDASLYRDNLTVMFHLAGTTALKNERVMMFFSVYAYGESRFNLTFNPCVINIPTMCPLNSSIPIEANGMIPIGPNDISGIPSIAFTIPDFEGQAILRLFSNSTESQIACYSAKLENGNSFSHPAAVGSILGIFTVVALVSSFAVAIYGQLVPEMRMHHAHSMSIFVVFSVLQHVFFTGSLSMNWPSVLVAFWSNYGWSAGMIYSRKMQNSINQFIGSNKGNISMVGSAPSNQNFADLGGGVQLSQIYKRDTDLSLPNAIAKRSTEHMLQRRLLPNITTGFTWYGGPVAPGLPLPGNYSGFAGTLAPLGIPASNAFLTGLLWLLVLIACVAAAVVSAKWTIEVFVKIKLVRTSRLDFFRSHWLHFTGAAVLRTCYIAFYMMMYLSLFQFVLGGSKNIVALAAVLFVVFFLGMSGAAFYALWSRHRATTPARDAEEMQVQPAKTGTIPTDGTNHETEEKVEDGPILATKHSLWRPIRPSDTGRLHVHDDANYTTKFGWLTSRFRRSRWWFFSAWLVYEFVRACFYGGAAGHPLTQVFGLLAWEIIAFIAIIILRPFESNRLNLVMVYFLGFSKVATVALSCAFDPRFRLSRILTTVIGIIIIIIQGALTICMMVGIVLGAISSYMSLTRNQETFKPESWTGLRTRFFGHVAQKATDCPRPPTPPPPPEPEKPEGPYFEVSAVRREPKIEDEDQDNDITEEIIEPEEYPEILEDSTSTNPYQQRPPSRVNSVRSRTSTSNLPYGARSIRRSWSIKDLPNQSTDHIASDPHSRISLESVRAAANHRRTSSMRDLSTPPVPYIDTTDWQNRRHRRTRSSSNPHGPVRTPATAVETNEMQRIPSHEE